MSISRKTTNTPTPIFPKKHSYTFPKIEMKPNYTQAPKQQKISAKNLTTHQKLTPTKSHQTFHFLDSPLVFLHPKPRPLDVPKSSIQSVFGSLGRAKWAMCRCCSTALVLRTSGFRLRSSLGFHTGELGGWAPRTCESVVNITILRYLFHTWRIIPIPVSRLLITMVIVFVPKTLGCGMILQLLTSPGMILQAPSGTF